MGHLGSTSPEERNHNTHTNTCNQTHKQPNTQATQLRVLLFVPRVRNGLSTTHHHQLADSSSTSPQSACLLDPHRQPHTTWSCVWRCQLDPSSLPPCSGCSHRQLPAPLVRLSATKYHHAARQALLHSQSTHRTSSTSATCSCPARPLPQRMPSECKVAGAFQTTRSIIKTPGVSTLLHCTVPWTLLCCLPVQLP